MILTCFTEYEGNEGHQRSLETYRSSSLNISGNVLMVTHHELNSIRMC